MPAICVIRFERNGATPHSDVPAARRSGPRSCYVARRGLARVHPRSLRCLRLELGRCPARCSGLGTGSANLARRSLDPTLQESAQRLLSATRYPKSDLTEPVLGARLSWSAGGVDVSYYYQYGFDGPLIKIDPAFAGTLASIDFNQAGLADLEPWLAAIDRWSPPVQASYVRRHHVGMDLATTVGPFAFRVDAAYESKRVFSGAT